jgi:hypothetical protein
MPLERGWLLLHGYHAVIGFPKMSGKNEACNVVPYFVESISRQRQEPTRYRSGKTWKQGWQRQTATLGMDQSKRGKSCTQERSDPCPTSRSLARASRLIKVRVNAS